MLNVKATQDERFSGSLPIHVEVICWANNALVCQIQYRALIMKDWCHAVNAKIKLFYAFLVFHAFPLTSIRHQRATCHAKDVAHQHPDIPTRQTHSVQISPSKQQQQKSHYLKTAGLCRRPVPETDIRRLIDSQNSLGKVMHRWAPGQLHLLCTKNGKVSFLKYCLCFSRAEGTTTWWLITKALCHGWMWLWLDFPYAL